LEPPHHQGRPVGVLVFSIARLMYCLIVAGVKPKSDVIILFYFPQGDQRAQLLLPRAQAFVRKRIWYGKVCH
jgi:hypothetical protein